MSPTATQPAETDTIAEVRYSLKDMLKELKTERSSAAFAMEKLDQVEIAKLIKSRKPRRKDA